MLHIHNGDCTAEVARRSSLPGEHFAFREALIEGPNPSGLSSDDRRLLRAKHLNQAYDITHEQVERELLQQEETLSVASEQDEVVLWFEHDLFCQVNLIYLLDLFNKHKAQQAKLSLVCIDNFTGKKIFRGLGELNADELASLFPTRQTVTQPILDLATRAWEAYCSSEPTDVEQLLQTDTSTLPFLDAAMRAHLRRFPSIRNGLGRVEDRALELIHSGSRQFKELFQRFGEVEPIYGIGDSQFWLALRRMIETVQPVAMMNGKGETTPEILNTEFSITELGEAVLTGHADFVALNGINQWLGGVYLSGEQAEWRWDEQEEHLVQQ